MNISIMLIKRDPSLPNPVNLIPLSLRTSCLKWRSLCFGHLRKAKSPTCHKAPFAGLVDVIESKLCDVSPSSKDGSRTPVGPGSTMAFGVMLVLRPQVYHSSSVSSEPLSTSVEREWCLVWRVARIPWEGAEVCPWQEVRGASLARLHCGSRSAAAVLAPQALRPSRCPFRQHSTWTREPGLSGLGGTDSSGVWFHLLTATLFPWGHDLPSLLISPRLVRYWLFSVLFLITSLLAALVILFCSC